MSGSAIGQKLFTGSTLLGRRWNGWVEMRDGVRVAHVELLDSEYVIEVQWDPAASHPRKRCPVQADFDAWGGALEMRAEREAGRGRRRGERK